MQKLTTEKKIMDINLVYPCSWNPNKQTDYTFQKMKQTIEEKGLFGSIIVRRCESSYVPGAVELLDGYHRWKACKELGWKEIPVEVVVQDVSDKESKFWNLYFNNTRGKDDILKRTQLMKDIEGGMAQLLPFTADEIKNHIELGKFDFAQYEKEIAIEESKPFTKVVAFKLNEEEYNIWLETVQADCRPGNAL